MKSWDKVAPVAGRGLGLLVVSALLTAISESFYWYSGGTDYPGRILFYLLPTTALLWALATFPAAGWPAVIVAGAAYGFVVEGVLTVVVYGGFPFDPLAISYTSLAWHAPISVAFGLVLLHRLVARGSKLRAITMLALFGAFWGLRAMSLRLPPDPMKSCHVSRRLSERLVSASSLCTPYPSRSWSASAIWCSAARSVHSTWLPGGSGCGWRWPSAGYGSHS
jgi:hypothetical protein